MSVCPFDHLQFIFDVGENSNISYFTRPSFYSWILLFITRQTIANCMNHAQFTPVRLNLSIKLCAGWMRFHVRALRLWAKSQMCVWVWNIKNTFICFPICHFSFIFVWFHCHSSEYIHAVYGKVVLWYITKYPQHMVRHRLHTAISIRLCRCTPNGKNVSNSLVNENWMRWW